MQYTVVHSTDPYLLARLATDLQMEGGKSNIWNSYHNPFSKSSNIIPNEWLVYDFGVIEFYNHDCGGNPIRHELTSRNYIKVLTQILQP